MQEPVSKGDGGKSGFEAFFRVPWLRVTSSLTKEGESAEKPGPKALEQVQLVVPIFDREETLPPLLPDGAQHSLLPLDHGKRPACRSSLLTHGIRRG